MSACSCHATGRLVWDIEVPLCALCNQFLIRFETCEHAQCQKVGTLNEHRSCCTRKDFEVHLTCCRARGKPPIGKPWLRGPSSTCCLETSIDDGHFYRISLVNSRACVTYFSSSTGALPIAIVAATRDLGEVMRHLELTVPLRGSCKKLKPFVYNTTALYRLGTLFKRIFHISSCASCKLDAKQPA